MPLFPPILHEDNHLLVVDKPPGLLSQGDHSGAPDLLSLSKEYIRRRCGKRGGVFVGLVHRLDRAVGGVMLFAKTSKAARRLQIQFQTRQVRKIYSALIERAPSPPRGALECFIRKDSSARRAVAAFEGEVGAKFARLIYCTVNDRLTLPAVARRAQAGAANMAKEAAVAATTETKRAVAAEATAMETTAMETTAAETTAMEKEQSPALILIRLITGRFHQIRFQFSSIDLPLLGDCKYGSLCSIPGVELALHCNRLTLLHPIGRERLTFESPLPSPWGLSGG